MWNIAILKIKCFWQCKDSTEGSNVSYFTSCNQIQKCPYAQLKTVHMLTAEPSTYVQLKRCNMLTVWAVNIMLVWKCAYVDGSAVNICTVLNLHHLKKVCICWRCEPSTYAQFPIIELYGRNPQSVTLKDLPILQFSASHNNYDCSAEIVGQCAWHILYI